MEPSDQLPLERTVREALRIYGWRLVILVGSTLACFVALRVAQWLAERQIVSLLLFALVCALGLAIKFFSRQLWSWLGTMTTAGVHSIIRPGYAAVFSTTFLAAVVTLTPSIVGRWPEFTFKKQIAFMALPENVEITLSTSEIMFAVSVLIVVISMTLLIWRFYAIKVADIAKDDGDKRDQE